MKFTYQFPAVKGKQAGNDFYTTMVPLKLLQKLFPEPEEIVSPEHRAQRRLNESRIPAIKKYILDNPETYVFSALAASIDGNYSFEEPIDNIAELGILRVDMDAVFLINDGQHRKAAIITALLERPEIGEETIPIVFFKDNGLQRSQQMFTDLNKHAVKTSNSIAELYDGRDDLAMLTKKCIENNVFLNRYTDKEKDNLGKFSAMLFSLNTFYKANKRILGKASITDENKAFISEYWSEISNDILLWNELSKGEITKVELRENYLVCQAVVIEAFGQLGNYFFTNKISMKEQLIKLKWIDWSRSAKHWYLRNINTNGTIIKNEQAVWLTCNEIKKQLGIPLSREEQAKENKFQKGKR
ncbi:MAG: DNA sulfur modification protein DndB [Lachnotalea sp.]